MSFSHLLLYWKSTLCYLNRLFWKSNTNVHFFIGLTPVITFLANRRQLDYQYCFDNPPVTTNMLLLLFLLFLILLLLLLLLLIKSFLSCSAVRKKLTLWENVYKRLETNAMSLAFHVCSLTQYSTIPMPLWNFWPKLKSGSVQI